MCKDIVSRTWYDFLSNLKQEEAEGNCVQVWIIDVTISLCCYLMSSGWTVVQERSYIRMGSCPVGQFTKKVIVICGCAINKQKICIIFPGPWIHLNHIIILFLYWEKHKKLLFDSWPSWTVYHHEQFTKK